MAFKVNQSFHQGPKVAIAARDICAVHGDGAMVERTARDWYAMLDKNYFDFKDAPCSGRPVEFDEERSNQRLHQNSRPTT